MTDAKKVVIVAGTNDRARELANELGLPDARKVSSRSPNAARGVTADVVLVDDSAFPLRDELRASLAYCLVCKGGSMYRIDAVWRNVGAA